MKHMNCFCGSICFNNWNTSVMLKNYFTIGLRNLRKRKGYAVLNIAGLATGMAACILMLLYVQDERSFDRFHEKADRIYRVGFENLQGGNWVTLWPTYSKA